MICKICFNEYDDEIHQPFSTDPCGHCFCIVCLNNLTTCPFDREVIVKKIINRGLLDVLSDSKSKNKNEPLTPNQRNKYNALHLRLKY